MGNGGSCEHPARLPRDGFINHLTADGTDTFGVFRDDRARLGDSRLRRGERGVNDGDLIRVDGGLGLKPEGDSSPCLFAQSAFIVDVKERRVDRHDRVQRGRRNQPASSERQWLPCSIRAEVGSQIGSAEHQPC